jgi:hypothetical protein
MLTTNGSVSPISRGRVFHSTIASRQLVISLFMACPQFDDWRSQVAPYKGSRRLYELRYCAADSPPVYPLTNSDDYCGKPSYERDIFSESVAASDRL